MLVAACHCEAWYAGLSNLLHLHKLDCFASVLRSFVLRSSPAPENESAAMKDESIAMTRYCLKTFSKYLSHLILCLIQDMLHQYLILLNQTVVYTLHKQFRYRYRLYLQKELSLFLYTTNIVLPCKDALKYS